MTEPLSYCGEQVRRYDPDRFLTCLFAPVAKRESLLALYAFNLELAKTRESVTEPMMGQIRLQWWREAIAELYEGKARAHPIMQALALVIPGVIEETAIQTLIEARELDLANEPPATSGDLQAYVRDTGGCLMQCAARLLGASDAKLLHAASELGQGVALTGLLRSIRYHAAQHRSYMPVDLLHQAHIDPAFSLSGKPFGIEVVTMLIAKEAQRMLESYSCSIPRSLIAAYLPARLAKSYLRRFERLGHDPFRPENLAPYPFKPLSLAWGWISQLI